MWLSSRLGGSEGGGHGSIRSRKRFVVRPRPRAATGQQAHMSCGVGKVARTSRTACGLWPRKEEEWPDYVRRTTRLAERTLAANGEGAVLVGNCCKLVVAVGGTCRTPRLGSVGEPDISMQGCMVAENGHRHPGGTKCPHPSAPRPRASRSGKTQMGRHDPERGGRTQRGTTMVG